tara:strand:- start:148 stop:567 length:420 start_codon:yes stop_codon:yes gene_type:complete
MEIYGNGSYKQKTLYHRNSKTSVAFFLSLIHRIFDTVNLSLLAFILIFSFLSLNSQREWSKTFEILSQTRAYNNNLIDYISKTEEFYLNELDSLNDFKKTSPRDLIYLEKTEEKKDNYIKNKIIRIISGIKDSRYQRGY